MLYTRTHSRAQNHVGFRIPITCWQDPAILYRRRRRRAFILTQKFALGFEINTGSGGGGGGGQVATVKFDFRARPRVKCRGNERDTSTTADTRTPGHWVIIESRNVIVFGLAFCESNRTEMINGPRVPYAAGAARGRIKRPRGPREGAKNARTTGCAFPRDFIKIMTLIIITRPGDFHNTTDVRPGLSFSPGRRWLTASEYNGPATTIIW